MQFTNARPTEFGGPKAIHFDANFQQPFHKKPLTIQQTEKNMHARVIVSHHIFFYLVVSLWQIKSEWSVFTLRP